jgi:hypothetical protein
MSFRVTLPPQVDLGLEFLATAYQMSKQDMIKTLVIAAVAEEPKIRAMVIEDFKAKLRKHAALTGEKLDA